MLRGVLGHRRADGERAGVFVTAMLCSLVYLAIQYTLSSTFQHIGKAICVILVFVQIPGRRVCTRSR